MRTLPENSTSSPGCSSECKPDRDLDERHEPELSGPTWPGLWRSGRRSPAPGTEPPAAGARFRASTTSARATSMAA